MSTIPDRTEYHTVTPYLIAPDIPRLIRFLQEAFGAQEIELSRAPDGRVMHAEVCIGDSVVMMGESSEPMPAMLYLLLDSVDDVYERAVAAGGRSLQEPRDEFYGHRTAAVQDVFGNQWWLATPIEEVSHEELQRRMAAMPAGSAG